MIQRISRLAEDIRDVARPSKKRELVSLAALAAAAIEQLREQAGTVSTEIELLATESGIVSGDPGRLLQVILNLIQNAIDAAAAHPTRKVRFAIKSAASSVLLAVEDSGPGVAPEQRKTIFKRQRQPPWLNISRAIAEEHGGVIEFSAAESGGAIFTLSRMTAPSPVPWRNG